MTTKEYQETLKRVVELCKDEKITKEEANSWIIVEMALMGKCCNCPHNNGIPNCYCENCED